MTGFQAFICYSHKDAVWKEQLCDHLASVGLGAAAWHDGNLRGGDAFEERIDAAIDSASLAIVLVSEHSLSSEYITQREVPRLLARRAEDGLRVIPVVVRDCAWKAIPWLASLELRPKGGEPLSSMAESDAQRQLAELAEEIHRLVRNNPPPAATPAAPFALAPVSVSTGRLPPSGRSLVGRGDELSALDDAWRDPAVTMLTLTAWAGVGKSALVSHWLGQMRREKYRGAERVFGWSFDGQGGTRATSADPFFHAALPWFGESSTAESSWEKGERLAEAVQRSRTLLVLDGLEPLQHPPGPNEGMLREDGLRAFLCALAERNQGLCVVTSREPILELATYEPDPARHVPLHTLDAATGASLLRALGVRGEESELIATVEEYDGHGLALTLLGSFLADVFQGDVRRRREVGPLTGDMRLGAHARRVLDSYESWFGEGAEIAALSWLSLMDRPTDEQTLAAICQEGPTNGMTEPLRQLSAMQWRQLLGRLQRAHLVRTVDGAETGASAALTQNQTLHLHPLVREHFRERLRAQPAVWQQANERLFELCQSQAEEQPATLDGLAPLYDAVRHGCWSGRCREALEDVYWPRIRRRNQGYSTRRLGAFQADAAALSHFFVQPYSRVSDELPKAWRAPVLSWTGFRLFALGRLPEAAQALRAALELLWDQEERPQAARVANHLFQVSLARGEFRECEALVERLLRDAVADPDIDLPLWRVNSGLLLWQRGQRREAEREFRKATLDEELPLEGHPLSTLCHKLPHRQAVQLVFAVTETGDDSLAADYALELELGLSDSSLSLLNVDCSGLTLESSDFEFKLFPDKDGADSDVQSLSIGADSDFQLVASSDADDSDVQLAGDSDVQLPGDSDVRLAGDSDVRLAGDSDVRLADDSDVRLTGDSDVRLVAMSDAEGSDLELASRSEEDESDIRLSDGEDSGGFELWLDDEPEQTDSAADALELAEFLLTADAEASLGEREARVSLRVHDQLCTLLRAHAEIVALEAEQPTPVGAADPDAPESSPSFEMAAVDSLDSVLDKLRRAGWSEFVVLALILRARRQRLAGQPKAALRDADEAEKLAAYCGLKLLVIDAQLVKTSILIDTGALADARSALAAAMQGAGQLGYHRQADAARALADRLRQ